MVPKPAGTAAHIPPERDERQGLNHAARPDRPIAFSGRTLCIFCGRGNRLGIGGKIMLVMQTPSASQTGNTEAMANAVAEGAKAAGAEVVTFETADFTAEKVDEFDAIAFGCPAMGDEVLEEDEFEPMFNSCETKLSGKKVGLFGSYGWGDGEWMHNWEDKCKEDGAVLVADGVICQDEPDDDAVENCKALGKALA